MGLFSTERAWEDMSILLNGVPVAKVLGLTYKHEREMEAIYGTGNKIIDIQPGNEMNTGTLRIYQSVLIKMNEAAALAGQGNICNIPWTIVIKYKTTAADPVQVDTLVNLRFTAFEKGMNQNDKSAVTDLPFLFETLVSS